MVAVERYASATIEQPLGKQAGVPPPRHRISGNGQR